MYRAREPAWIETLRLMAEVDDDREILRLSIAAGAPDRRLS